VDKRHYNKPSTTTPINYIWLWYAANVFFYLDVGAVVVVIVW